MEKDAVKKEPEIVFQGSLAYDVDPLAALIKEHFFPFLEKNAFKGKVVVSMPGRRGVSPKDDGNFYIWLFATAHIVADVYSRPEYMYGHSLPCGTITEPDGADIQIESPEGKVVAEVYENNFYTLFTVDNPGFLSRSKRELELWILEQVFKSGVKLITEQNQGFSDKIQAEKAKFSLNAGELIPQIKEVVDFIADKKRTLALKNLNEAKAKLKKGIVNTGKKLQSLEARQLIADTLQEGREAMVQKKRQEHAKLLKLEGLEKLAGHQRRIIFRTSLFIVSDTNKRKRALGQYDVSILPKQLGQCIYIRNITHKVVIDNVGAIPHPNVATSGYPKLENMERQVVQWVAQGCYEKLIPYLLKFLSRVPLKGEAAKYLKQFPIHKKALKIAGKETLNVA